MNIVIIGTGGVGGYFGGKIAQYCTENSENKVYFIARGEHLKKIKECGLKVKTQNEGTFICRPYVVSDDFNDIPMIDICFICVKGYDLKNVLNEIKNKIKDDTEIIPLLNGIDIVSRIRKVIKKGILYPACVYIGTHIESPGVIAQNGGSCTIIFGNEKNNDSLKAERVCDILKKSNIKYEYTSRNYEEIWSKYMFIASYGLVTACYKKTLGEVTEDKALTEKVLSIMNLIKAIADKEEIKLMENIVNISYDKAKAFPYETKTSFQRDYEKGNKRDERDTFGKTIIDMAEGHNINCELVKNIYEKLN